MTLRYERLITAGPTVNYHRRETWTPEVQQLYERLVEGDRTALAPLLAIDIEFITDQVGIKTLILLKYDPDYPAAKARAELRKIASVIQRRPGRRPRKLPPGDLLLADINALAEWIEAHGLLAMRKDLKALEQRIEQLRDQVKRLSADPGKEPRVRSVDKNYVPMRGPFLGLADSFVPALLQAAQSGARTSRGWAKQAFHLHYGVEVKIIDKRIARDPIARGMRAQARTPHRGSKPG